MDQCSTRKSAEIMNAHNNLVRIVASFRQRAHGDVKTVLRTGKSHYLSTTMRCAQLPMHGEQSICRPTGCILYETRLHLSDMSSSGEVTLALQRLRAGKPGAQDELIQLVYGELRNIASRQLRNERPNHTLQSTALVHEAYLSLLGGGATDWKDRSHFFAASASAMRHILVDHARMARAQRRGGGAIPVELNDTIAGVENRADEILAVDEALQRLREISPRQESIVEMRFYAGFTEEEVAEILHLSERTVKREWAVARAWLHGEMRGSGDRETQAGL